MVTQDKKISYEALKHNEIPYRISEFLLPQLAKEIGPGRMLDLGCGHGLLMKIFYENGWDCVGVDIDAVAIKDAAQYGEVILREGEQPLFSLEEHSFDLGLARSFFHHAKDVDANLSELIRCVKPGKLILIWEEVEDSYFMRLGRNIFKAWQGMPVYSRLYLRDWFNIFRRHDLELICAYGSNQWLTALAVLVFVVFPELAHQMARQIKLKKLVLNPQSDAKFQSVLFILQKRNYGNFSF